MKIFPIHVHVVLVLGMLESLVVLWPHRRLVPHRTTSVSCPSSSATGSCRFSGSVLIAPRVTSGSTVIAPGASFASTLVTLTLTSVRWGRRRGVTEKGVLLKEVLSEGTDARIHESDQMFRDVCNLQEVGLQRAQFHHLRKVLSPNEILGKSFVKGLKCTRNIYLRLEERLLVVNPPLLLLPHRGEDLLLVVGDVPDLLQVGLHQQAVPVELQDAPRVVDHPRGGDGLVEVG